MKLALLVYFASLSTGLCAFLMLLGLVMTFAFAMFALNKHITYGVYDHDADYAVKKRNEADSLFKVTRKLSVIGPLCIVISILIPSEKTIYIMAGAYATEQIATNDRVQKIGSDVLKVIENKLEKLKEEK